MLLEAAHRWVLIGCPSASYPPSLSVVRSPGRAAGTSPSLTILRSRNPRTRATSSGPPVRRARGAARRRSARSRHAGSGWIQAPRPGLTARASTSSSPLGVRTRRSSCVRGALCRQPIQVRSGTWGMVTTVRRRPSAALQPLTRVPQPGNPGAGPAKVRRKVYIAPQGGSVAQL